MKLLVGVGVLVLVGMLVGMIVGMGGAVGVGVLMAVLMGMVMVVDAASNVIVVKMHGKSLLCVFSLL